MRSVESYLYLSYTHTSNFPVLGRGFIATSDMFCGTKIERAEIAQYTKMTYHFRRNVLSSKLASSTWKQLENYRQVMSSKIIHALKAVIGPVDLYEVKNHSSPWLDSNLRPSFSAWFQPLTRLQLSAQPFSSVPVSDSAQALFQLQGLAPAQARLQPMCQPPGLAPVPARL